LKYFKINASISSYSHRLKNKLGNWRTDVNEPRKAFSMHNPTPDPMPIDVIEQQLKAYNQRDIDAWLATYAPDAVQRTLDGQVLANGHGEIWARTAPRMLDPKLHAQLLQPCAMGEVVIDHEIVRRQLPEGLADIEMVCIYVVRHGLIQSATFQIQDPVWVTQDKTGG
jgi:hypothetical protein